MPPLTPAVATYESACAAAVTHDFFALVRKLLTHSTLRAAVEKLAAEFPDPLDADDDPSRKG